MSGGDQRIATRAVSGADRAAGAYWHEDAASLPPRELFYHDLLDSAVASAPEREALVFLPARGQVTTRLTYRELDEVVNRAARALLANGLRRGSRAAVYATNRPEFVFVQFACSRIGAAAVPINPLYEADELTYLLERVEPSVCFVGRGHRDADLWANASRAGESLPGMRLVALDARAPGFDEWLEEGDRVGAEELDSAAALVDPRDTVQILFTSGTTGRPKAVELGGYALANGGHYTARRAGLRDGCRYMHAMPFFHVGGTVTAMATLMAMAGTHLFLPSFSPSQMCAAIDAERPDAILAVPTMLIALAAGAEPHLDAFRSIETVLTGGALVPEPVAARWIEDFGVGISNTYGMSEVAGPAVQTSPEDPLDRALSTCGRPLPGVEVDIVVPGTGERVEMEAEGEIRFRGWGTMNGYLKDEQATRAILGADGWLRSGDLGRLSSDGFVQVTGRAKDVIIRGGENIAPASVEDAIREHIEEIVDVSVVGVPDDYYGEAVAAFVTMRGEASLSQAELAQRLEGKIAHFRIPAHLRVIDELPTTPSGKVQKFKLRAMFAESA